MHNRLWDIRLQKRMRKFRFGVSQRVLGTCLRALVFQRNKGGFSPALRVGLLQSCRVNRFAVVVPLIRSVLLFLLFSIQTSCYWFDQLLPKRDPI